MEQEIAKTIYNKVRLLPRDEQEQILAFLESEAIASNVASSRPIWEIISERNREVPEEEWAKSPTDGAMNHDHYLYGAQKKKV